MENRISNIVFPAVAGAIAAVIITGLLGIMKVEGTSMEPSIQDGSLIFVNKLAYFYRQPEVDDVVVFRCNVYSEDEEGSILIRRVAAVEGDHVRITDGNLYVNDKLYETRSENNIYQDPMDETVVGQNRVFVLSDSQTAVLDSRDQAVGQLRIDELKGRVCFR